MVRYFYRPNENVKTIDEIEYYKTHACPKGDHLFKKRFEQDTRLKPEEVPLSKFLLKNIKRGDLVNLITNIGLAVKIVSATLRGKCHTALEAMGFKNYPKWKNTQHCETIITNVFINQIKNSGSACIIGCKHFEKPIKVEESHRGRYAVVISPIDGPRGMDTTGCMGSVFGIYPILEGKRKTQQILQKGRNLICACYAMYGSSTVFYIALRGKGTNGFILQIQSGEFVLVEPHLKIPSSGPLYSLNEGHSVLFEEWFLDWLYYMKNPPEGGRLVALSRNTSSPVADIHQILKWGGIYISPKCELSDIDEPHYLVFELIPLSFILEEAGGLGTTGRHLILDVVPKELKEISEAYIGSKINISLLLLEINPSLLIKCRLFTVSPTEYQGGKIHFRGLAKNTKDKNGKQTKKGNKRKVRLRSEL